MQKNDKIVPSIFVAKLVSYGVQRIDIAPNDVYEEEGKLLLLLLRFVSLCCRGG